MPSMPAPILLSAAHQYGFTLQVRAAIQGLRVCIAIPDRLFEYVRICWSQMSLSLVSPCTSIPCTRNMSHPLRADHAAGS